MRFFFQFGFFFLLEFDVLDCLAKLALEASSVTRPSALYSTIGKMDQWTSIHAPTSSIGPIKLRQHILAPQISTCATSALWILVSVTYSDRL